MRLMLIVIASACVIIFTVVMAKAYKHVHVSTVVREATNVTPRDDSYNG